MRDIGGLRIIVDEDCGKKKRRSNLKEIKMATNILLDIKDLEEKLKLSQTVGGSFHLEKDGDGKEKLTFHSQGIGFGKYLAINLLKKLNDDYKLLTKG